jgi:hypothetical protein
MTSADIDFIKDTLYEAKEWGDYVDDYTKNKQGFYQGYDNVQKCNEILNKFQSEISLKSKTCNDCRFLKLNFTDGVFPHYLCKHQENGEIATEAVHLSGCNRGERK